MQDLIIWYQKHKFKPDIKSDEYLHILKLTDFLDDVYQDVSLPQRMWHIRNNNQTIQKCKKCGETLQYNKTHNKYYSCGCNLYECNICGWTSVIDSKTITTRKHRNVVVCMHCNPKDDIFKSHKYKLYSYLISKFDKLVIEKDVIVNNILCDIVFPELKLIVFYYDDFAHMSPKTYNHNDTYHGYTYDQIHQRDEQNIKILESCGYQTCVVWKSYIQQHPRLIYKNLFNIICSRMNDIGASINT